MQTFHDHGRCFRAVRVVALNYTRALRMSQYSLYMEVMQELPVIAVATFPEEEMVVLPKRLLNPQALVESARFYFCGDYCKLRFH